MRLQRSKGFTLLEILVITLLLSVVLTAGSLVFVSGQNIFSVASVQSDLQVNASRSLQRLAFELQSSGRDSSGNMKVAILDNTGVSGSDIVRFSIPLCVCGLSPIDTNGNVSRWGAPLVWGQDGCSTSYTLNAQGKVDICHHPPGNPTNTQDLSVSVNAVKAHLAHGDSIGGCSSCNTSTYTNRTIEYLMDANGRLLRRVLDSNGVVLNSVVFAQKLTNFQASFGTGQTFVNVTLSLSGTALRGRTFASSNSMTIFLRNF